MLYLMAACGVTLLTPFLRHRSGMQYVNPMCHLQSVASAKDSQLIIETVVPIGSVLLIAAISALAAYTGQRYNCLSTLPLACMAFARAYMPAPP